MNEQNNKPAVPESAREAMPLPCSARDAAVILYNWINQMSNEWNFCLTAEEREATAEHYYQNTVDEIAKALSNYADCEYDKRIKGKPAVPESAMECAEEIIQKHRDHIYAEIINIKSICDTYDEFGHSISADCRLSPLAERVYGIISEQAERVAALGARLKKAQEVLEELVRALPSIAAALDRARRWLEECDDAV
jgi:hypothetical protein